MGEAIQPPLFGSRFIEGAAGQIHVRDFGGAGQVIIALHGVTSGTFLWDGFADALGGRARLIAMDFRGHGLSDWSSERAYTTDAYAEDLEATLAALDLDAPPILMGSSWGALAAIRVLARRPATAVGLIIVDVEPSFAAASNDVVARPYKFSNFQQVLEWERNANPAADDALGAFAKGSVTKTAEGAYLRRHDPYFLSLWPFRDDDLWDELRAVTTSALVVNGDRTFVRREVCEKMATVLSNGEVSVVLNSGHLIPLEQPEQLVQLTEKFIQKSTGRKSDCPTVG